MSPEKTIFFETGAVGAFRTFRWPRTPGVYRYMPFRSMPHLRMHERLRSAGSARCYYERAGKRVYFTVNGHPKYGQLQCDMFELTENGPSSRGC